MSVQAIQWAYKQKIENMTAKFTLVTLANYCNEKYTCWPGVETLAEDMGIAPRSVQRALRYLSDGNFIETLHRSAGRGSGRMTNRYVLPVPFEPAKYNLTESHPVKLQPDNDDIQPDRESPNPLVEPSKEKKEKKQRARKPANGHPPPDGVAPDLWSEFLAQRKHAKARNTDRAIQILTNRLADNKAKTGESYTAQIERAIESGWKTVWPLRTNGNGTKRPQRQEF